jgi:hypothetical protein
VTWRSRISSVVMVFSLTQSLVTETNTSSPSIFTG